MPKNSEAHRLGAAAEDLAERYLRERGLETVLRNFRVRGGEIDLIMRDAETLVFVEVRYRSHHAFGGAPASVDPRKQQRLVHAARCYLQKCRSPEPPCRFDIVGLSPGRQPGTARVQWIRDAFSA